MDSKTKTELRNLFLNLDSDKNGYIDIQELKSFITSLGMELNSDEIKGLFIAFDENRDGKIDIGEFMKVIMH
jgi:calmodulin